MTDSISNTTDRWTREQLWFLGAIAVVAIVLGWLGRQPLVTTGGDDATYILLAQSLRHGQYRDIFLPGSPAHAQYPPGFPLLILAVRTVAMGSLEAVRAVNLLLLALTAVLTAAVARRIAGNTLGMAAAALVMLNPMLLHYSGWILSDIFFLMWTSLALWASHRAVSRSRKVFWLVAGCAALAAFFTRSVGITIVLAVIGGLVLQRRRKVAPLIGAAAVLLIVAWFAYTHWAANHTLGWSYRNDLAYLQPGRLFELFKRTLWNARDYGRVIASAVFGIPDLASTRIDNRGWCLLIAGTSLVGLWWIRKRWPTAVLYALLMAGVLLVFPFTVQRLLVPLVPVLIVTLLLGVGVIARRLGSARPDRAIVVVAVILASAGLVSGTKAAVRGFACRASERGDCRTEAERAWMAAADWAKAHLPPDAVIASAKPSTFYLMSGRRGIPNRMLFGKNLDDMLAPKGPVTDILISDLWDYERTNLSQALLPICGRLRPVPHADNRTLIVEVVPGDSNSQEGCHALQEFTDTLLTGPGSPTRK